MFDFKKPLFNFLLGSTNTLTINSNPATFDTKIGQNLVEMNPHSIV